MPPYAPFPAPAPHPPQAAQYQQDPQYAQNPQYGQVPQYAQNPQYAQFAQNQEYAQFAQFAPEQLYGQQPTPTGVLTALGPAPASADPKKKKFGRTTLISVVGLAYLLLAAGAAAAVVAVASPAPVNVAALTAPTTAATSAASSTSAAAGTLPTASAPTQTSTVTGTVSGGVHHGDLRFFLLPAPGGPSSVQGTPDGTTENEATVVGEYGSTTDSSEIGAALKQLDFRVGATRTYQDSTLGANVTIELLQFGSHDEAKKWLGFFDGTPTGATKLTIPGESGSNGWSDSQPANDAYSLIGMFVSGDTFYNITVFGSQQLDDNSLINLMSEEYNRLANG